MMRAVLSFLTLLLSFSFIGYAAFGVVYEDPANRMQVINTSLGFIFGTGLTLVLQYYFGSSEGSKEKTRMLGEKPGERPPPSPKPPPKPNS